MAASGSGNQEVSGITQTKKNGTTEDGLAAPATKSATVVNTSKKMIHERESFQRINYLFQAAQLINAQCPKAKSIPSFYGSVIHGIAQKSLIRLHPNIKRQMCRGCKSVLLPGVSAKVSVKSHPCCQVLWMCLLCGTMRRMPAKRGYKLWVERPDAIVSQ